MKVKVKFRNGYREIYIPDSKYWKERNKRRVSKYWKNADNLEKRTLKEFQKAYNSLEKELYTFIGKFGTDNKLKFSRRRIAMLMNELKPYIESLYEYHQTSTTDLLIESYKDNYLKTGYELALGFNISPSFVGINETTVKTAISYPWSGLDFSERIYNNKSKLVSSLREEITQSIIRGDSIAETSRSIKKRLDISTKNATRLIQTEMGAVLISSSTAMYKEFDVEELEFSATLDNRTSNICRDLDGSIIDVDNVMSGVNAPPMHPNCRSDLIPSYDGKAYGAKIAKRLDNNKYEYVPSDITYREWEKRFVK